MKRLLLLPFIFILLNCPAFADKKDKAKKKEKTTEVKNIITLEEMSSNKKSVDTVSGLNIVDINSSIRLSVNKNVLMEKTNRYLNINTDVKLKELQKFTVLMQNHDTLLKATMAAMKSTSKSRELASAYNKEFRKFRDKIKADTLLRKEINDAFLAFAASNANAQFNLFILNYIEDKHKKIIASIDSIYKNNRIQFSMVAFRADESQTKIHIENYDEISNGEYYEVERWVTSLSEEDKKTLQEYTVTSKEWNESNASFMTYISRSIKTSFASVEKIEPLRDKIQTFENQLGQMTEEQKTMIVQFMNDTKEDIDVLAGSLSKFEGVTITTPFEVLNGDLHFIDTFINSFTTKFQGRLEVLKNKLGADYSKIRESVASIKTDVDALKASIEKDVNEVSGFLAEMKAFYNINQNIYSDNQEISEKVKKFDVNTIPEIGYIDLKYTGKRDPGDEIIIRFVLRQQVGKSLKTENITLERHIIRMQKVGVYNETCVSLIMTTPTNKTMTPKLTNDFQFSPSASFIFKVGTRNSRFVNFMEPGLGLDFATTDFNLDGTLEFGSGLAITLLRNTLSAGWNYNFAEDVPYYFIGINLPIRSSNLLGQGIDNRR